MERQHQCQRHRLRALRIVPADDGTVPQRVWSSLQHVDEVVPFGPQVIRSGASFLPFFKRHTLVTSPTVSVIRQQGTSSIGRGQGPSWLLTLLSPLLSVAEAVLAAQGFDPRDFLWSEQKYNLYVRLGGSILRCPPFRFEESERKTVWNYDIDVDIVMCFVEFCFVIGPKLRPWDWDRTSWNTFDLRIPENTSKTDLQASPDS